MPAMRLLDGARQASAAIRRFPPRQGYTRAEHLSDAVVHAIGVAAAVAAAPLLVVSAASWRGDPPAIAAAALYGAVLIAMLLFSALYNVLPPGPWTGVLQRLDHAAIYFKIAGTFTAFGLLSGGGGAATLGGLWGAALLGTTLRTVAPERTRAVAIALYLVMGWFGAIAGWELISALPAPVPGLILAGGLLYSLGVVFYLFDRLPHHITVWHVFVLVATALIFAAMLVHVAHPASVASPVLAAS